MKWQCIKVRMFKEKRQLITLMLGIMIAGTGLMNTVQSQAVDRMTSYNHQQKFYEVKIDELISLEIQVATIEEALRQLADQIGVKLTYRGDIIDKKEINISENAINVSDALDIILSDTNLRYRISQSGYLLIEQIVQPVEVQAVLETVRGVVVDAQSGEALPGVNILVQGTTDVGTVTNLDGEFELNVPSLNEILIFSSIGYERLEVDIAGRTTLNIQLMTDVQLLEDIVVIGYGVASRESLTGSVSTVRSEALEQVPVTTFEQTLRGNVAGLRATAADGAPGSNTEIRIRGIGSISASSEPLYVIDGVPVRSGSFARNDNSGRSTNVMSTINPNDIESISVLKDAASTAIYGSRGANGVILINTKSGQHGDPIFSFKTLTGFNSQAHNDILKPINAAQYTELFLEGHINNGDTPEQAQAKFDNTFSQLTDPSTGRPTDTNWLDAITRRGVTQSYDLSARGGTNTVRYFVSLSHLNQENFVYGSDFSRYSARTNLDIRPTNYLTISNNVTVSDVESTTFNDGGSWVNPFKNSLELSPLIPIYDEQGRINGEHANYFPMGGANPVGSLIEGDDTWTTNQFRLIDNLAVSVNILENLTFRSQWNIDILKVDETQFFNRRYGSGRNRGGYAYEGTNTNRSWVGTQTLNYYTQLGANHNLDALLGYEAQQTKISRSSASGTQFPNDQVRTLNSASSEFDVSGSRSEFSFASMFARLNYNYSDKYFISGSLRRDGSSRFGANNRWGNFYSIGASWIASNESFLNDISFIDLIKLRSSYGLTGNAEIGNYASQGLYVYGQDYDGVPGGRPSQIGNPNLGWETQENFNIGLDFGLFSRISGTVEYFKRVSSDLILNVPISLTSGFNSLTQNFGEMTNSGIELTLNVDIINNVDYRWSVGFNTTFLKNEITKLDEDFNSGRFRRQVGEDFQSFYLFNWAGIDQTNGQPQWYTDETKTTTTNSLGNARRFFDGKSATPDFSGGFNTVISYKNFSSSANFIYSYGNYILDDRARGTLGDGRLTPRSTATYQYDNRWVPGKTDALFPEFRWGGWPGSGENANARWLYDGSFIRLQNLTVAYNFSEALTSRLRVSSLRMYLRGTNLLTFTKEFLYIDPEQGINGLYTGQSPALKSVSLGIDIQL